jgi:hypothetical protein
MLTRQETDPFIQASKRTSVDLVVWATSMMERNNRRSHLIPQPPPSETQSGLMRSNSNGAYPPAAAPVSAPAPAAGMPTPLAIPLSIPVALASASSGTSSNALTPTPSMSGSTPSAMSAPPLRTPTTATTADMVDAHMQALSLDHGSPLNRPYPVRTSSQQVAAQQSPANGSILRAPPSGPLPQIPRNSPF